MNQNTHVTEQGRCHTHQAFKVIFQKKMLARCPHSSQLLSFVFFFNKHVLTTYYSAWVIVVTVNHRSGKSGSDYLGFLDSPLLKLFLNMPVRQHLYKINLPIEIISFFIYLGLCFYTLLILLLLICFSA